MYPRKLLQSIRFLVRLLAIFSSPSSSTKLTYDSGTSPTYCSLSCQAPYGVCTGSTYGESFLKAVAPNASLTDTKLGGEYYYDVEGKIFWTWDTPALITRKFEEIIKAKGLGGVMVWSLAEDAYDWSRVKAINEGFKKYF